MKCMKILLIIVFTLSSGCATTRSKSVSQEPYTDISLAAQSVSPILKLIVGGNERINIGQKESPKIIIDNITSNFEVLEIEGLKNQNFSINLYSACDCLGFRKWVISSAPYLFDPEGKKVDINIVGGQLKNISGHFPQTGKYRLLVVADTTYVGELAGRIDVSNYNFTVPLVIHPEGTVQVVYIE